MSNSENAVLHLVDMVYDAALEEQKWPSFLDEFAQAVGGCSAMLRSADLHAGTASFAASVGYDPAWQAAFCNHYVKLDYYIPYLTQLTPGITVIGEQALSLPEQRKTEIYNDYFTPQDKLYALGSLLYKDGDHTLLFAAQRGKRAGAFGEEEARLMNILSPHVTRAVQVHRKLSSIALEKEWALGALDQLRMGVILTDSLGVPLFVNCAAEQMMETGNGMNLNLGRLSLNSPSETALLQKLIANAAQCITGTATGGDMRITLPNRFDVLHCLVAPVSPEFSARLNIQQGSGCVAIFLSKPGSLQLPPERLAVLYGLSPAESRLVAKLAAFDSLEQVAEELCISILTARSQLKSVFAKTGARSQSKLLMLLATGTLANCHME